MPSTRGRLITVRLFEKEIEMLNALKQTTKMPVSVIIRQALSLMYKHVVAENGASFQAEHAEFEVLKGRPTDSAYYALQQNSRRPCQDQTVRAIKKAVTELLKDKSCITLAQLSEVSLLTKPTIARCARHALSNDYNMLFLDEFKVYVVCRKDVKTPEFDLIVNNSRYRISYRRLLEILHEYASGYKSAMLSITPKTLRALAGYPSIPVASIAVNQFLKNICSQADCVVEKTKENIRFTFKKENLLKVIEELLS